MWKTQQWPQDWKRSVFIPIQKKGNAKECSHYHTIALISYASKVMLKILQVRLQQYMTHELPDVQAGFRKGRGTRDQIANVCWVIKRAPWDSPGKNTVVGCHLLLQGIFQTQGSNPDLLCLLLCKADSLPWYHMGSPH